MNTKHTNAVESIDKRTIRAATESMTIVALGRGEYKVYSGTRKSYVVDVIRETCECPDEEFNHPSEGCKHRQRVCMELGQLPIPDLGRRTDVEIMVGARVDETEPVAIADGGAIVEPEPQGESDETGRPDDCDCSPAFCDDDLGCWPCYRDGFETMNPAVEDDEEVSG